MFLNDDGQDAPVGVREPLRPAFPFQEARSAPAWAAGFPCALFAVPDAFGGTDVAKAEGADPERRTGSEARSAEILAGWHARYDRWLAAQIRRRFSGQSGEDIAQETWLRLAACADVEAIQRPKAFLLRVATNLAVGQARRRAVADRFVAVTPPVVQAEADQLEAVFLRQIVLDLPQSLRDVFLLSRVGGLTNSQIAEQLGISQKTVEWRMTRALARCAAQLRR
ncbi:RNA polymerase sigma factor [Brevundimonas sp. NPDC090276]|uniref:RNA polymerase sigma factor n=1 Tax=Brevundimonas sp. NPDC090276 TaxID=3363956 RepID=UPI00383A5ED4